jgi:pimeloyl-ACP methyl ester carboxylesterase
VETTGLTVVITKPTLNLAFFDQRPLAAFTAAAPDVSSWFVGGHSLGGVRACMLAADTSADVTVNGLVLFGSYCASPVDDDLPVLSISGSAYGAQPGDGVATIPPAESAQAIEDALGAFVVENSAPSE